MKSEFMTRYFGNDKTINEFVIRLITYGRRDVALEVNNAIRILGVPAPDKVSSFIEKVEKKYNIYTYKYGQPWQAPAAHQHEARASDQHDTEAEEQRDNQAKTGIIGFVSRNIL